MRKLIFIFLFSCTGNLINPDEVKITFGVDVISISNARISVTVPGFEMKYDTVNLLVNNTSSGTYYNKQSISDIVREISVAPGIYDVYMNSDGNLIFNDHLVFSAILNDVDISEDVNLILPTQIQQAIVLIAKAGIVEPPIITDIDDDYGPSAMIEGINYYYIYVYGSWQYYIDYIYNDVSGQIYRTFETGKIYRYNINSVGVDISDPFDEIIDNY